MAKKRSCRRTVDEDRIHEKAVKMRKMTDEQLVHYVEDRVEKVRSEGYNEGYDKGYGKALKEADEKAAREREEDCRRKLEEDRKRIADATVRQPDTKSAESFITWLKSGSVKGIGPTTVSRLATAAQKNGYI